MSATAERPPLNDKRTINGWAFFDWANSSYALVITVAIFPAYFASLSEVPVDIFGIMMPTSTLYAYALSAAYLIIAVLSPLLSGIADYGGKKMTFLRFFTYLGSFSCMALFFFQGVDQLLFGTVAFMLATIGFAGGLVFYNAYLPEIASEDQYDRVSAKGFAYGYIGSVILLLINLVVILFSATFGLTEGTTLPVRLAFLMVGLWWLGWSFIPFSRLPRGEDKELGPGLFNRGVQELKKVWQALQYQRNTKRFLFSFFCYSAGVQTVLYLASTFAEVEFSFATQELIAVILLLQVLAIVGAFLSAKISKRYGNKVAIICLIIIWIAICLVGYVVQNALQFYVLAGAVGLVMGGIQSMSRSTYSKLLPVDTEDTTSYFSFYDILEKVSIVSGTFIFGLVNQLTGSMRGSILVLAIFFVVGLGILLSVRIQSEEKV